MRIDDRLLLGIDAGGSKTSAVVGWASDLSVAGRAVAGRAVAGPGNPRVAGFDVATAAIAGAVRQALDHAGMADTPPGGAAVCLGAAGAGVPRVARELSDWLCAQPWCRVGRVEHDARLVIAAGTPDDAGIALIAGTGSLAYGLTRDGREARRGGHGPVLSDEGSGFDLVLQALRYVVRASEQRAPATALERALLEYFNVASTESLVDRLPFGCFSRAEVAAAAPVVLRCAQQGDAAARRLLQDAARQLAELVDGVADALALSPEQRELAVAGGLLIHQADLRDLVIRELEDRWDVTVTTGIVTEPEVGALQVAAHLPVDGPCSDGDGVE